MTAAERMMCCDGCGLVIDRDRKAAANLAAWAERFHRKGTDAPPPTGAEDTRGGWPQNSSLRVFDAL
jgi:transposase